MVSAPGGRSFTYDADNNIVEASVGGTNWSFRYNSANQMVWSKKVINAQTIDERFYLYDGLDCIAEVSPAGLVYREFMRVGNVGGVVAEFVAIDPTVPTGDYSTVNYYHYNHRGDVIAVTRNSQVIFEADYDAYGTMIWSSGSFKPRYTFSTKRHFDDFNVYYYGYRWYLPELGRWMQKDPIGLAGGSANEYSFCANNPVNMVDPIGLKKDSCPDGGSGGRSGRGSGGRGGGSGWWPVNIAGAFLNELNPLNTHGTFYRQANSIERALAFEYDDAARDSTQAILDDQNAPSWARGTHYGALAVSATATAVAAGLMMANVDPWLGRVSIDNAHHGIQSAHFEVIIRGAGKFIKELPFNIQRPIEIF